VNDMLVKASMYNLGSQRETTMQKVTISAAMMVFATLLVSAPAMAVDNHGPSQINGQCFKSAMHEAKDLNFGTWGACPKPASTTVAAAPTRRAARRASR